MARVVNEPIKIFMAYSKRRFKESCLANYCGSRCLVAVSFEKADVHGLHVFHAGSSPAPHSANVSQVVDDWSDH